MKIREIESFTDCALAIMYGTEDEFVQWLKENGVEDVSPEGKDGMCGPIVRDGNYVHCVWARKSDDISVPQAIATMASHASRVADNIDNYVCSEPNSSLREQMPPELRARVIEKIVRVGTELILDVE